MTLERPEYKSVGAPFYGHLGRASSFAKATEDKDARPSLSLKSLLSLPTACHALPVIPKISTIPISLIPTIPVIPAERPPYRTVACFPTGTTATKGLADLPDIGASFIGHIGRASSFPVIPGKSVRVTMTGQNSPRWDSYCRPRPPPRHCASLPIPDIRFRNLDR